MVKLINDIAILDNITSKNQSLVMFEWLKAHTEQRLYLIRGRNDYGCGVNGELVLLAEMSSECVDGGYCINPFYCESQPVVDSSPEFAPEPSEPTFLTENTEIEETQELVEISPPIGEERTYTRTEVDEILSSYVADVATLRNANQEGQATMQRLLTENIELREQLFKNDCDLEACRMNSIDPTDVTALCKALATLGFDVSLTYYGEEVAESGE